MIISKSHRGILIQIQMIGKAGSGGTDLPFLTTWEAEAGGFQVKDQPGQLNKTLYPNKQQQRGGTA